MPVHAVKMERLLDCFHVPRNCSGQEGDAGWKMLQGHVVCMS